MTILRQQIGFRKYTFYIDISDVDGNQSIDGTVTLLTSIYKHAFFFFSLSYIVGSLTNRLSDV